MNIRLANEGDIPQILAIKRRLAYAGSTRGGFLLGCDERGYLNRLRAGRIWVLAGADLQGFAITLYPKALQASPLWALRDQVQWAPSDAFDALAVSYFDQLAVLPEAGHRAAVRLAYVALTDVLEQSEHVLTTTVSAPVVNLAAVPLIERVGGVRVGQLAETYPELGALTSDLWLINAATARSKLGPCPKFLSSRVAGDDTPSELCAEP